MRVCRRVAALVLTVLTGIGGTLAAAAPAAAAPPDGWGFAYSHDPAPLPGTVLDPTRQWSSSRIPFPPDLITIEPLGGAGHYRVRFPHLATKGGVPHVTAVLGAVPAWCKLDKWGPKGADELVEVQCYRHGGFADNTRFAIVFTAKSAPPAVPGGHYAYVHADSAAVVLDSYNSAGGPNAAGAGPPGIYKVHLPGVGLPGGFAGNVQVTAAEPGKPYRCKVADVAGGVDVTVYVSCVDPAGAPTPSAFTLSYHRERSVFGEVSPPKRFGYVMSPGPAPPPPVNFNSTGAANALIVSGVGQTLVVFRQLGIRETHTQVTAFGGGPDYCSLQDVWRNIGVDGVVRNVICFNGAGAQANNRSFVTFSSRV